MYVVALLKNEDGEYHAYFEPYTGSGINLNEIEKIESLGYTLETCIITTDKVLSLKARLKYKILELKSLREDLDYMGYDTTLMNQIGLLTARLLKEGIDVDDEIALQCYDLRLKERRRRKEMQG